jgi:hypothetical protein
MRFVSDGPRNEFGARKPFAASEGTPYRPIAVRPGGLVC